MLHFGRQFAGLQRVSSKVFASRSGGVTNETIKEPCLRQPLDDPQVSAAPMWWREIEVGEGYRLPTLQLTDHLS
jgi:hypothetical protein